ncbi:MAG: DUF4200 domain-containing protein [Thermofilum sp.]|nr:DUF4200 domain-containing protein [Thermofilum sp.]
MTVIGIMLGIIFFLTVSEVIAHSLLIDRKTQIPELVSVSNVSLASKPGDALSGKRDLYLFKAGATHYEVRLLPENTLLIYLEPDKWQGNSDVYPLAGGKKVGHHHSQFQVLSPGRWLTGGEYLIDFRVISGKGKIVVYSGSWGFRDYFVTTAIHYIWADGEYLYRYVKTDLAVLRNIPDPVGAIWVALANDPDYYADAVANTCQGLVSYNMRGLTGHALREYALCSFGWIALVNPLNSEVKGSPALVLVWSSSTAHPTVYSGANVDNIEIHLLGRDEARTLTKGEHFELHYLLIVSNQPNNYTWINEAVERAKPIIELIDKGNTPETASALQEMPSRSPQQTAFANLFLIAIAAIAVFIVSIAYVSRRHKESIKSRPSQQGGMQIASHGHIGNELAMLAEEAERYRGYLKRLEAIRAQGKISEVTYGELKKEYANKLSQLQAKIRQLGEVKGKLEERKAS